MHTHIHIQYTCTYTRMYEYMNSVSGLSNKCSGKVLTHTAYLEWRKRDTVCCIFYNIVCFAKSIPFVIAISPKVALFTRSPDVVFL